MVITLQSLKSAHFSSAVTAQFSTAVDIILPDGSTRDLGLATPAGPDVGFQVTVQVPPSAKDGPASVSDDRTPPAKYHFTVKPAT
jgi:hypothetical protein